MKSNENSLLTPRQQQALPHLLASPSYEEAARRAGITAKQIHEWLKDQHFREELERQRNHLFSYSLASLKASVGRAVSQLIALLDDEDPRIRLTASDKILTNAFKATEIIEFEQRISALEALTKITRNPSQDDL